LRRDAQPRVLELAGAPLVAQVTALSGEKPFGEGKDRTGIENRKGIKGDRFDCDFKSGSLANTCGVEGRMLSATPTATRNEFGG
jgi:hypothetical protein